MCWKHCRSMDTPRTSWRKRSCWAGAPFRSFVMVNRLVQIGWTHFAGCCNASREICWNIMRMNDHNLWKCPDREESTRIFCCVGRSAGATCITSYISQDPLIGKKESSEGFVHWYGNGLGSDLSLDSYNLLYKSACLKMRPVKRSSKMTIEKRWSSAFHSMISSLRSS